MRQSVSKLLRIAVLGATGATGRHVVTAAVERGHDVIALTRRPGSFEPRPRLTETTWADLSDAPGLTRALAGADVVISTLGGANKGPTTVCTDGIRTTVASMGEAGVSRLIVVSAHGVLDSHDRSLYSLAAWAGVGEKLRDKESMEPVVTGSGLEWTLVRPPALTDAAATGAYQVGTDLPIRLWSSIGRADLAGFLVAEAESPRFVRAHPRIYQ
ncbi:NAD(P)-dependent oxidoreductase [Promicromonospora sp. CA-289599]|uniref:NAD(P)-dependent oxidoreductase n=1 Tax=Promicromonospora sp. CA-289599 TaxID=3240014 RepID=UPI003D8DAD65